MANKPFVGYPGQVWGACWQTMAWFVGFMNGGATRASDSVSAAEVTFRTMLNGIQAVTAWQIAGALAVESLNMTQIQVLPLGLSPINTGYFNSRVASIALAAQQIALLPPPIDLLASPTICATGQPAIPDPGFIEWCMTFAGETPPNLVVMPDSAILISNAWQTIALAVASIQGSNTTAAYDAAARIWRASNLVTTKISAMTSGPYSISHMDPVLVWNQLAGLPTLLTVATTLMSAPSTLINQQCAVIRHALARVASQLALFLLSLRKAQVSTVATSSLRNGETLMDLAARTTGDFEDWATIAAINGLQPPYPSPLNQTEVGATLLLPTFGTAVPATGAPIPSYETNILGVDYDFGAITKVVDGQLAQGVMPPWNGDFNLITGYPNLRRAIGRRLQTTLGTLIYHTNYGSRIPPEVGAIQAADEAVKLAVFARSAITADPRVNSIMQCSATVTPPFLASVDALIEPVGFGASPVAINETLSPLP